MSSEINYPPGSLGWLAKFLGADTWVRVKNWLLGTGQLEEGDTEEILLSMVGPLPYGELVNNPWIRSLYKGAVNNEEFITLYRGVDTSYLTYKEALQGIAKPLTGEKYAWEMTARWYNGIPKVHPHDDDVALHAAGNVNDDLTS